MLKEYPDILTPRDVMEILSISKNTFYSLVHQNEIPAFRLGSRSLRIQKQDLIYYLKNIVDWD